MARGACKLKLAPPERKERYCHNAPEIGPYSSVYIGRAAGRFSLTRLDGRTKEAALLRQVRDTLLAHVGENPTVVQMMLIDRAAVLMLRLAQIDRRIFADQDLTILDNNQTVAWQNCLTRVLVALGVRQPDAQVNDSDLSSYLAEHYGTDGTSGNRFQRGARA